MRLVGKVWLYSPLSFAAEPCCEVLQLGPAIVEAIDLEKSQHHLLATLRCPVMSGSV